MFSNTQISFQHLSDKEVKKSFFIFSILTNRKLVSIGVSLATYIQHIPFLNTLIKNTIFKQFCSGETLEESLSTVHLLKNYDIDSVPVYGVEVKNSNEEFNNTCAEILKTIVVGNKNEAIPFVSVKITGLLKLSILEKIQKGIKPTKVETIDLKRGFKRLLKICNAGQKNNISIFFDAEETWIQGAIDSVVFKLMKKFNQRKAIVFNTHQMYLKNRIKKLKEEFYKAQKENIKLGVKLVRGAYMEIERKKAEVENYQSPICENLTETHKSYNEALKFCIENIDIISICNATHNEESCVFQIEWMKKKKIPNNHKNIFCCQLLGMGNHISFKMAQESFNVCKYLIYGKLTNVIPYLIRRSQENTSIQGAMSRELTLIKEEHQARKNRFKM